MDTTQTKSAAGGRRHTFARGGDQRQYDHEVLDVARVVRVVKGGRRFRFRASVIAGDRAGNVGFGIGKSKDVQQAIQKATDKAAKNMVHVKLDEGTIAHTVQAKYNGAVVFLKPAKPGTGVIAGGTIRMVADLLGVKNLASKTLGSTNRVNNARATLKALEQLLDRPKKNPKPQQQEK